MTFTPDRSSITDITQAIPSVVTTSTDHGLFTGNIVRLNVPKNYGMFQLDNLAVHVNVLSTTTFSCWYVLAPDSVPVDSRGYPAFVIPTDPGYVASVIPMGSGPTFVTDTAWQINNGHCESLYDDAVHNDSTVNIPF